MKFLRVLRVCDTEVENRGEDMGEAANLFFPHPQFFAFLCLESL
jgi:hypothetical protein